MVCNNAKVITTADGRYAIDLPEDKKHEMRKACEYGIQKHGGYVHVEISKVRKPRSLEQNNLFHSIVGEYFTSGLSSYRTFADLKNHLKVAYGVCILAHTDNNGAEYYYILSTAEYSTGQFGPLIDGSIKEALLHGVQTHTESGGLTKFGMILDEIGFSI